MRDKLRGATGFLLLAGFVISTLECGAGERIQFTFEKIDPGDLPAGWKTAETHGVGTPAKWGAAVLSDAPGGPKAFGILETKNPGPTYNLALLENHRFKDLDLNVAVKAISGERDQGGGPVWRAQDENNYYVARWNPLEDNFRAYHVKDGKRTMLKSAEVEADPTTWHTIRVLARGSTIAVYFDGKPLFRIEDNTFPGAGMAGLWTKADAATFFDEFNAIAIDR